MQNVFFISCALMRSASLTQPLVRRCRDHEISFGQRTRTGTNVYNPAGEKLGSIYDVMLAKDLGKADYAIMSFGGFLGIGEQYHPLPWDSLICVWVVALDIVDDDFGHIACSRPALEKKRRPQRDR